MASSAIARLDAKVQRGNAKLAKKLGQNYNVYRLSANTSATGIVSPASLIQTGFLALFQRLTSRADIEIETTIKALYFTADVDLRPFLPGDVFVQQSTTYRPDRGVFTLASARPMPHEPVFIETPIYATISRPESNPDHIDSGIVPQSVPIKANEWPLTLTPGSAYPYSFQRTGYAATVPIGMVLGRLRDYPKSDTTDGELYDDTRRQTWDCFLPLLPGQPIIPRDIITGANGDRYEITGVQTSTASFFGQLVSVQRIRS